MRTDVQLAGQVAIVTGAARGIGRATASALTAAGATVAMVDQDEPGLEQACRDLATAQGAALPFVADLADSAAVSSVVGEVNRRAGNVDIVVSNAGVIDVGGWERTPFEVWRRTFAVNVDAPFALVQAVVNADTHQTLKKLVVIGSGASESPTPGSAAYGASKAALRHLSRTWAHSLGERGVATTLIYPGTVRDGMWRDVPRLQALEQGTTEEELVADRLATTPTGRFQTAEAVADLVLWVVATSGTRLNGRLVWTEAHVAVL